MLAAPQLLPVLEFAKHSHRAGGPTDEGYQAFAAGALKPFELTGLVYPTLLGNPTETVPDLDVKPPLSSYWPQYVKCGSNFAETAISLGPVVVLMLCFMRRRTWRKAWPMVAVGAAGLLIAIGSPLAKLLYYLLPGWSATGSTGRAEVLVVLCACVVAALGTDGEDRGDRTLAAYAPLLVFGALTAGSIVALTMCGYFATPFVDAMKEPWPAILKLAAGSGERTAILAAVLCVAVGFALVRVPRWGRWALVVASAGVPLLLVGSLVRTGSSDYLDTPYASADRFAFVVGDWEIGSAARALMPPNTAAARRMHDVAGYDSLIDRDTVALLRDIDGGDPAPPANGNMMFVKTSDDPDKPSADPVKLAEAGVDEVWSLKPLPRFGTPTAEDNGILRYRLAGPGRASTPAGRARVVDESFDGMTVDAEGPGKLTVRDRALPGWTATVDGRPATVGGALWLEVDLPPGRHLVKFSYQPPGMIAGFLAMLAGLVVSAAWCCVGLRGYKRGGTAS
jgi:hypothetical protein